MSESINTTRREFVLAAGIAGLAALTVRAGDPPPAVPEAARPALEKLKDGNRRFAEGKTRHAHEGADWRKHLVADQKPIATILGCSDSRVPPELVFDQGFGDLFIIRVAGNVIAPDVVGSLAYAIEHLHTPLIVVMGHQNCGAVTAALEAMANPATAEPPAITALLKLIEPGLKDVDKRLAKPALVAAGVEANVRWSLRQLLDYPRTKNLIAEKKCYFVGSVYELSSGVVRFLDG